MFLLCAVKETNKAFTQIYMGLLSILFSQHLVWQKGMVRKVRMSGRC